MYQLAQGLIHSVDRRDILLIFKSKQKVIEARQKTQTEIDFRGSYIDPPNSCRVFHFPSFINPLHIRSVFHAEPTVHHRQAASYHFSRNIISASASKGYINLNPLSATCTPLWTPLRRRRGGFCYFYLIIPWAYSGVRIHLGWQVPVPFESPITLCSQCFATTPDSDKCVLLCVQRRGGFYQRCWVNEMDKPFSDAHSGNLSHKCSCFLFDCVFYTQGLQNMPVLLRLLLIHCKRNIWSWGSVMVLWLHNWHDLELIDITTPQLDLRLEQYSLAVIGHYFQLMQTIM